MQTFEYSLFSWTKPGIFNIKTQKQGTRNKKFCRDKCFKEKMMIAMVKFNAVIYAECGHIWTLETIKPSSYLIVDKNHPRPGICPACKKGEVPRELNVNPTFMRDFFVENENRKREK
jgi:hypothetical protein